MNKIATLIPLTILMGFGPINTVNSNNTINSSSNTSLKQQYQRLSQSTKNEIESLTGEIKDLRNQTHTNRQEMVDLFKQNKELKNQLTNSSNTTPIYSIAKPEIIKNREKIKNLKNINTNLRTQINKLQNQIKSLI